MHIFLSYSLGILCLAYKLGHISACKITYKTPRKYPELQTIHFNESIMSSAIHVEVNLHKGRCVSQLRDDCNT